DNLPDDVKKWTPEDAKKFLISKIKDLDYKETDIKTIRDEPSPAESIMELVEELNEKLCK
ncbi:7189_t:CDS:2, partial [Funneliformis geosporum]